MKCPECGTEIPAKRKVKIYIAVDCETEESDDYLLEVVPDFIAVKICGGPDTDPYILSDPTVYVNAHDLWLDTNHAPPANN